MYLDIVFILIIVLSFYYGFSRGIVKVITAVSSLIFGFFIAHAFMPFGEALIAQWFELEDVWLPICAFLLLFIITVFIIRLFGKLLESILKISFLNVFNRILGGGAFLFLGSLVLSIVLSLGVYLNLFTDELKKESYLFEYFEMVWPWFHNKYPYFKAQILSLF
jgi:membrane protein required for colicin V production